MISPAEQQTSRAAVLIVRILTGISKKSLTTALLLYCSELTSFRRDCDMISPAEQQTSRAAVLIVRILTGISKKVFNYCSVALLLCCSEMTSFRRDCDLAETDYKAVHRKSCRKQDLI